MDHGNIDEVLRVLDMLPLLVDNKRLRESLTLRQAAAQAGVASSTLWRLEAREGDLSLKNTRRLLKWVAS